MEKTGIFSLVKILSKNAEMQLPEKKLYKFLAAFAALGIMIPCTVIVGFISFVMTEALIEVGAPGGGMLFEMQILSAFSMIFGILVIFSILFFSSDREHFVTLPIPAHHLMMSKFIFAYIAESIMEFMILAAVFIGYLIAIGKNIGIAEALNPVSIIGSVLGVVLIPLIPMIYCAIFSLILMAALRNVKSTKIFYRLSTVFLLIFAAIFILSLRGIGEVNMENYVESLGNGDNLMLKTLNIIFFPVPWLSDAISAGSILKLLLYIVGNVGLMVILFFVGKAFYQEGLYTAASLGSSVKAKVKDGDIVMHSRFKASLLKELKVILRTKAFSGNCAFINLIWPVGVFLLFQYAGDKGFMADFIALYQTGKDRAGMILIIAVIAISFIATALNSLASTAITREGCHIDLLKFIPVPYETQLLAKAAVCVIFTFPSLVLTDIIICIYLKAWFLKGILYAIMMLLAHLISVAVGMMLDSNSPYREWDDEYSALRGNLNVFFNMAIMMLLAVATIILGIVIYDVLKLPIIAYYIIIFLVLAIATRIMFSVAPKKIAENMDNL